MTASLEMQCNPQSRKRCEAKQEKPKKTSLSVCVYVCVCACKKLIQMQVWVPTCEKEVKRMDVNVCVHGKEWWCREGRIRG